MVCIEKDVPVDLHTIQELKKLFTKKCPVSERFYHMHLEICRQQNAAASCQNCNRMHICLYV